MATTTARMVKAAPGRKIATKKAATKRPAGAKTSAAKKPARKTAVKVGRKAAAKKT